MDSFLVFFYILEQCYTLCHEDDLDGFLGAISPELWTDGKPIDIAIYNDWQTNNKNMKLDPVSIVIRIYELLETYEKKFGYDFSKTKKTLISDITEEMIREALKQAKIRYSIDANTSS